MMLIGVDEVGRGCLSGPVVAAAVASKEERVFSQKDKLKDSKCLHAKVREYLAPHIMYEYDYAIGWCYPHEIDKINIHNASLLAMKRACETLLQYLERVHTEDSLRILVDGKFTPNIARNTLCSIEAIVKGDSFIPHIQAASILAKTVRDDYIRAASHVYPMYRFETHKGYPTSLHRNTILKFGVSPMHRKSFKLYV